MTSSTTKPKAVKRQAASMFDLRLPSGVRLGDASVADLEQAVLDYAEASDTRARLMRELIALAVQLDRGSYG